MGLIRSWVESANRAEGEFPLNNLPCGVFSVDGEEPRCGVAIGDFVLDAAGLEEAGLLALDGGPLLDVPFWNEVMEAGPAVWSALRARLQDLLAEGAAEREAVEPYLVPLAGATLHMPFLVAEYTDFYAGKNHAFNVGSMFRGPENALPPNWLHIPIGYNGRASSVVVSGTPVRRPWRQVKGSDHMLPSFQPSRRFDLELEMGAVVGRASEGMVSVAEADEMIFGYVLLNDWSARDIQAWEYQPLGPFLSKSFISTISPWVVTAEALEPFRCAQPARPEGDPQPLSYLLDTRDQAGGAFDIELEVLLLTERMREQNLPAHRLTLSSTRSMYWTVAQMVAHHSVNGCQLQPGDLFGSGTLSGATPGSFGSLLEITEGGKHPVELASGEVRKFLEDGDEIILRARCTRDGVASIGFGECRGTVIAAN